MIASQTALNIRLPTHHQNNGHIYAYRVLQRCSREQQAVSRVEASRQLADLGRGTRLEPVMSQKKGEEERRSAKKHGEK